MRRKPVQIGLVERLPVAVNRVAHGDRQTAEGFDRVGHQTFDDGQIGHVAWQQPGPTAAGFDLAGNLFGSLAIAVVIDRHGGTGLGQFKHDSPADSSTAAGH